MFEPISGLISIFTGIAGSITTAIVNYKMKKLDLQEKQMKLKHEEVMVDKETEAMVKEAELGLKKTQVVYEGKEALIDASAWKSSLKDQDKMLFVKSYIDTLYHSGQIGKIIGSIILIVFALIDALKASIRPCATIYIMGIATWISYKAYYVLQMTSGAITQDLAGKIFILVVTSVFQLLFVIIGWWFADRRLAKDFVKRLEDKKIL